MRLFKDSIERVKKGTNKLYHSLCDQKGKGILIDFTEETVDGQDVWNIVGSLEIRPEDLDEKGKLPVKIGVLSGDLILYTDVVDQSVLPSEIGGKIIFKHVAPEEETVEEKGIVGLCETSNVSSENTTENNCVNSITQDLKEIDWEERHFQICLALLSRTDLHSYHSNTVSTVDPKLPAIVKTADRMVELLKEHSSQTKEEA